eukprot:3061771-Amphidinium_carterae.1
MLLLEGCGTKSGHTLLSKLEPLMSIVERKLRTLSTLFSTVRTGTKKGVKPACRRMWTDGSGRHSSNPHFRRCGVGYVTDTGERTWLALPGCRQS